MICSQHWCGGMSRTAGEAVHLVQQILCSVLHVRWSDSDPQLNAGSTLQAGTMGKQLRECSVDFICAVDHGGGGQLAVLCGYRSSELVVGSGRGIFD